MSWVRVPLSTPLHFFYQQVLNFTEYIWGYRQVGKATDFDSVTVSYTHLKGIGLSGTAAKQVQDSGDLAA